MCPEGRGDVVLNGCRGLAEPSQDVHAAAAMAMPP